MVNFLVKEGYYEYQWVDKIMKVVVTLDYLVVVVCLMMYSRAFLVRRGGSLSHPVHLLVAVFKSYMSDLWTSHDETTMITKAPEGSAARVLHVP